MVVVLAVGTIVVGMAVVVLCAVEVIETAACDKVVNVVIDNKVEVMVEVAVLVGENSVPVAADVCVVVNVEECVENAEFDNDDVAVLVGDVVIDVVNVETSHWLNEPPSSALLIAAFSKTTFLWHCLVSSKSKRPVGVQRKTVRGVRGNTYSRKIVFSVSAAALHCRVTRIRGSSTRTTSVSHDSTKPVWMRCL